MPSQDFTFAEGDNGEPILATVHWSTESSYNSESSKPIVLILHAGGYIVGSKSSTPRTQITYLTTQNFIAVLPNYRLAPQLSARDGAFLDTRKAWSWAQTTLPALLQSEHGITADSTRAVAMGYSAGGTLALHLATLPTPPKAIAPFYPSLYVSEPSNPVHFPYAGFAAMPPYEPTPENEDELWNRPSGAQISDFPFAAPGSPPKVRNRWQFDALRRGTFMRAVQPDGDYEAIDPCVHFKDRERVGKWPPTMFVQGDMDDVPGSGIGSVERAVEELRGRGRGRGGSVRERGRGWGS
ncbi:hypothetical protein G7Y79_00049g085100 [Physcia stellaris]|nr:hypothetical protein G7Y79_00049g085100 [Physcia stellaris]